MINRNNLKTSFFWLLIPWCSSTLLKTNIGVHACKPAQPSSYLASSYSASCVAVITRTSRFTSCFRIHSIPLLCFVPKLKFSPLQLLLKLVQVHLQEWWTSPVASTCKYLKRTWQEDQTHCNIWQSTFVLLLTIKLIKKLQGLNHTVLHKFQKTPTPQSEHCCQKPDVSQDVEYFYRYSVHINRVFLILPTWSSEDHQSS